MSRHARLATGLVGCLTLLAIGWTGLLIPSLIRSIEDAFDQSDAGIGLLYFIYAVTYAIGSLGGGLVTERVGRRTVLSLGAVLYGAGLIAFGMAPTWIVFALVALPTGLGAGALDGGVNGLVLDLYPSGRGRALNLLHLFFSLGALTAPLVVGRLVDGGVAWEAILTASGVAAFLIAACYAVVRMPDGRRDVALRGRSDVGTVPERARPRLAGPLILLAVAIACYVASEIGVSSWLVRFLDPAPLSVATTALSAYWAGLTLGRLLSARVADRFDHISFTTVASTVMAVTLLGAILAPSVPLAIALFALAGVASGPVFPMIIAIGGDRYPDRSAAVSGLLAGSAVVGSVVYPPIMGLLSVTVGLTAAMLGTVVLALACSGALALVGRDSTRRSQVSMLGSRP